MLQSANNAEELAAISREGQKMLQQLEDSTKPVVAAIMGPALGGGLEVLSCYFPQIDQCCALKQQLDFGLAIFGYFYKKYNVLPILYI